MKIIIAAVHGSHNSLLEDEDERKGPLLYSPHELWTTFMFIDTVHMIYLCLMWRKSIQIGSVPLSPKVRYCV